MSKHNADVITVPSANVLVAVGDTHFPYADKARVAETVKIVAAMKPDVVIQIGDLFDTYMFSRFSRSVNLTTPAEELEAGKAQADEFWASVHKASPKAKCYQLVGNHSTTRIIKQMMAKAPELESLLQKPLADLMAFEGVITAKSHRSEIHSPDWVAIHGWSCRPMFHATYFNKSVVCGHTHRGGVSFRAGHDRPIFELNCGHVADLDTLPLQYGETATSSWVSGAGVVDRYGPRFIPL